MNKDIQINLLSKKLKRYTIALSIVLIAIPIAIYSTLHYSRSAVINGTRYPLLDPLREFTNPESYITNVQGLREYLQTLGDKYPDSISIYYENINSGANISVNRDLQLFPASLSKLVQAILIAKKVELGVLSWDTKLAVEATDISSDSGTLYQRIGDTSPSIDLLLEELLVDSDNTAQNIFRRQLTVDDYIKFQYETGLQDLYNEKGFISAKEYSRLLRVLYTSSYLEPEHSEKILDLMSRSTFKEYLSQGIPEGVAFAHKYGENKEQYIFADSGIVYVPGKPFMISVLIKGKDSSGATRAWAVALMKDIAERVYQASK